MKQIISALILVSVLFCLCACGETNDVSSSADNSSAVSSQPEESKAVSEEESSSPSVESSFKVTVVDQGGNPVSGVMIQICKDTCIPAKTDENGMATFNIEITAEHKLSVLSCPAGYEYGGEAEVYLDDGITEYTVEVVKLAKED